MTTPTVKATPSDVAKAIAKSKADQAAALAAAKAAYPAKKRETTEAAARREGNRIKPLSGARTRRQLANAAGLQGSVVRSGR